MTTFTGGALSFKGDKKKKSKKKGKVSKHKHQSDSDGTKDKKERQQQNDDDDATLQQQQPQEDLTDVERRAIQRRKDRENVELCMASQKSHRDRIEEFNGKLAAQTEHNDIPRVRIVLCIITRFQLIQYNV